MTQNSVYFSLYHIDHHWFNMPKPLSATKSARLPGWKFGKTLLNLMQNIIWYHVMKCLRVLWICDYILIHTDIPVMGTNYIMETYIQQWTWMKYNWNEWAQLCYNPKANSIIINGFLPHSYTEAGWHILQLLNCIMTSCIMTFPQFSVKLSSQIHTDFLLNLRTRTGFYEIWIRILIFISKLIEI